MKTSLAIQTLNIVPKIRKTTNASKIKTNMNSNEIQLKAMFGMLPIHLEGNLKEYKVESIGGQNVVFFPKWCAHCRTDVSQGTEKSLSTYVEFGNQCYTLCGRCQCQCCHGFITAAGTPAPSRPCSKCQKTIGVCCSASCGSTQYCKTCWNKDGKSEFNKMQEEASRKRNALAEELDSVKRSIQKMEEQAQSNIRPLSACRLTPAQAYEEQKKLVAAKAEAHKEAIKKADELTKIANNLKRLLSQDNPANKGAVTHILAEAKYSENVANKALADYRGEMVRLTTMEAALKDQERSKANALNTSVGDITTSGNVNISGSSNGTIISATGPCVVSRDGVIQYENEGGIDMIDDIDNIDFNKPFTSKPCGLCGAATQRGRTYDQKIMGQTFTYCTSCIFDKKRAPGTIRVNPYMTLVTDQRGHTQVKTTL